MILSLRSGTRLAHLSGILGLGLLAGFISPVNAHPIPTPATATAAIATGRAADNPSSCPEWSAIANRVKPDSTNAPQASGELAEDQILPTSTCAADLTLSPAETQAPVDLAQESQETVPPDTTVPPSPELMAPLQIEPDSDRWRFQFQPYATIPVTIYGTATAKGQTVNYSLSLAQTLQYLTAAASGRVEAWKGNWGFILDGYYANLQGIGSFQKAASRTPGPVNAVDYLLTQGVNTNVQQLANQLDQQVQALNQVEAVKVSPVVQNLDQEVQSLQATLSQDAQNLETLATNLQSFQNTLAQDGQTLETLASQVQDVQAIGLTPQPSQGIKTAIALNNAVLNNQAQLEVLQQQVQSLGTIPNLDQVQENLLQTKAALEAASQKVQELQQVEDSEPLRQLQATLEQDKAAIDQQLQAIEKIKNFQDNREPQEFNADINTALQFNQGIYDFAISYNFGDTPPDSLPEKPSDQQFPRFWFQPIAGVRLNDINIEIQNTINYQISSSLVNLAGSTQNTIQQGRTWFEPMLGAKFGLQLSDPLTLWLRGDASGFGLAGDTDMSWNVLFGLDWWVRQNVSLQLAYRFYEINYKNGTGSNAFGFSESFNGPFLSATFHF